MSGGSQENQVLSQAEIDAMLSNAEGGSELDDPLMASPAPHAVSAATPEPRPPVIWSTASPTAPLPLRGEAAAPSPAVPPTSPDGSGKAERPGFLRRILGKGDAGTVSPAASAASSSAAQRPRPALDIEDDLAAAALPASQAPDPLDAVGTQSEGATGDDVAPSAVHALDAAGDVMSVFLEHEGMDPLMRRLIEKVPDVAIDELLQELREVSSLLGLARGASTEADAA